MNLSLGEIIGLVVMTAMVWLALHWLIYEPLQHYLSATGFTK